MRLELVRYNRNCPKASGWFSGKARKVRGGEAIEVTCANGEGVPFGLLPGSRFVAEVSASPKTWNGHDQYELSDIELDSPLDEASVYGFLRRSEEYSFLMTDWQAEQLAGAYGGDFERIVLEDPDDAVAKVGAWVASNRPGKHRSVTPALVEAVADQLTKGALKPLVKRLFPSLGLRFRNCVVRDAVKDASSIRSLCPGAEPRDAVLWLAENPYLLCLVHGIGFETAAAEADADVFPNLDRGRAKVEAAVFRSIMDALFGASCGRKAASGDGTVWDYPLFDFDPQAASDRSNGGYVDLADGDVRAYVLNRASNLLSDFKAERGYRKMDPSVLDAVLPALESQGLLVVDRSFGGVDAYLPDIRHAHVQIREFVKFRSGNCFKPGSGRAVSSFASAYRDAEGRKLTAKQAVAVSVCLRSDVSVLTGGPGTGKSFCVQAMKEAVERMGVGVPRVYCLAPTGKAVTRLRALEALRGVTCLTVHAFTYNNQRARKRGEGAYPTGPGTLVVVDEASMLDVKLAGALLDVLADGTQVVFAGDVDQLPSVQPGEVLRDLVDAGLPCGRLVDNMRSGPASAVVSHAASLARGDVATSLASEPGFSVEWCDSDASVVDKVRSAYRDLLANGADFSDIAVITPRSKGARHLVARVNLTKVVASEALRRASGQSPARIDAGVTGERMGKAYYDVRGFDVAPPASRQPDDADAVEYRFSVGDRVINTRNEPLTERVAYDGGDPDGDVAGVWNYIANGDVGTIERYYPDYVDGGGMVLVLLDDGTWTEVLVSDLYRQWQGAWAMSVHKCQGSEYDHVIVALPSNCPVGLAERSLLYTAVTRARGDVTLIGPRDVMIGSIAHTRAVRPSRLSDMLR